MMLRQLQTIMDGPMMFVITDFDCISFQSSDQHAKTFFYLGVRCAQTSYLDFLLFGRFQRDLQFFSCSPISVLFNSLV